MDSHEPPTLEFYTRPAAMTSAGRNASLLEDLPHDIAGLAAVAHGLLIHEHIAPAYGRTLTDDDRATVHIRRVEGLLEQIVARDPRPLQQPRPVAERVAGN